eukprot:CAMPEP_0194511174 /NCGR_PEP_ID=MMETSP0253-20130528/42766_1 /TAXON_ID=2966 /ORGANISM="Noctiluca scintillans" /LENGTH=470 /DNA_ID=CAMNT_0039354487 /DNA_START=35 /DNA_END=1444 /DNA_ORIENTATION=-
MFNNSGRLSVARDLARVQKTSWTRVVGLAKTDRHCEPESARILKHGHMSIAKPDCDGDLLEPPCPTAATDLFERTLQRPLSWRCSSKKCQASLYRDPVLPVQVGELPGGSVISVQRYKDDTRDWRKLDTKSVEAHFQAIDKMFAELHEGFHGPSTRLYPVRERKPHDARDHEGLMTAIAVGTLQAIIEGSYWAPSFHHADRVVCDDIRVPMSRIFRTDGSIDGVRPRLEGPPELTLSHDMGPIDMCRAVASDPRKPRVALVRLTAIGDQYSGQPVLADFREAQLFLRTTYLHALQEMPRHLHGDPNLALEDAIVHTSDVSILRGPLSDGGAWLADPPRVDVIWAALRRHPRSDHQGQYARIAEKASVAETVDRIFSCAVMHDIDTLVFPPLGVGGASGCHHPAADAGDLLRKAILAHGQHITRVCVCQEHVGQLKHLWPTFAQAVETGRNPIEYRELVSLVASPYLRPGW